MPNNKKEKKVLPQPVNMFASNPFNKPLVSESTSLPPNYFLTEDQINRQIYLNDIAFKQKKEKIQKVKNTLNSKKKKLDSLYKTPQTVSTILEQGDLGKEIMTLEAQNKDFLDKTPLLDRANATGTIMLTTGKYFAPKPLAIATDLFLNAQDAVEYYNDPTDTLNQASVASDLLSPLKSRRTKRSPFSVAGDLITLKQKYDMANKSFNDTTSYKKGGTVSKNKKKKAIEGDILSPINLKTTDKIKGANNSFWNPQGELPSLLDGYTPVQDLGTIEPGYQNFSQFSTVQLSDDDLNDKKYANFKQVFPKPNKRDYDRQEDYDIAMQQYNVNMGLQENQKEPNGFMSNPQGYINAGLSLFSSMYNPNKPKSNSKNPNQIVNNNLSPYGAPVNNNQGIGQSALSKNGKTLKKYANKGLQVENNQYTPISNSTFMLDGNSHDNGGTDLAYYGNKIEAEKGEPITVNHNNDLVIFGNLTVPGTKKKYKQIAKEIGKQEAHYEKKMNIASDLLETSNPDDKWESLKFNSGKAMLIGANSELEQLQQKKNKLGEIQELHNEMLNYGKKAKYGKTLKAEEGVQIPYKRRQVIMDDYNWVNPNKEDEIIPVEDLGFRKYKGDKTGKYKGQTTDLTNNQLNYLAKLVGAKKGESLYEKIKSNPQTAAIMEREEKEKGMFNPGTQDLYGRRWTKELYNSLVNQLNPIDNQPIKQSQKNIETLPPLPTDSPNQEKKPGNTEPDDYILNYRPKSNQVKLETEPYNLLNDVGELYAMATNHPRGANYRQLNPTLEQPYQLSFQDRRNQVLSNLKTSAMATSGNPEAQYVLQGQAAENLQPINGDEFRTNQQIYGNVANNNRQILNQFEQYNGTIANQIDDSLRQSEFHKNAVNQAALSSMASKRLKKQATDNELLFDLANHPQYVPNLKNKTIDYIPNEDAAQIVFGNGKTRFSPIETTTTKKEGSTTIKTKQKSKNGSTISHSRLMKLMN